MVWIHILELPNIVTWTWVPAPSVIGLLHVGYFINVLVHWHDAVLTLSLVTSLVPFFFHTNNAFCGPCCDGDGSRWGVFGAKDGLLPSSRDVWPPEGECLRDSARKT